MSKIPKSETQKVSPEYKEQVSSNTWNFVCENTWEMLHVVHNRHPRENILRKNDVLRLPHGFSYPFITNTPPGSYGKKFVLNLRYLAPHLIIKSAAFQVVDVTSESYIVKAVSPLIEIQNYRVAPGVYIPYTKLPLPKYLVEANLSQRPINWLDFVKA
jgi:hypothetical protein